MEKPLAVIAGQKWIGEQLLRLAIVRAWRVCLVAAAPGDHLASLACGLGLEVCSHDDIEQRLPAAGADIMLCAHFTRYVSRELRDRFRMGVLAYHPSFLPRHRGGSSVEWTVRFDDRIAGGSLYWMDDGMDAGPIAVRRAVHVMPGENALSLWKRALAPLGIELFREVMEKIECGERPMIEQEQWAATWEPTLRPVKKAPVARS